MATPPRYASDRSLQIIHVDIQLHLQFNGFVCPSLPWRPNLLNGLLLKHLRRESSPQWLCWLAG
jgi:hypothetical protein